MASIRWVGNENGIAPYPNWYTLKKEDLQTGVATALHSDPDGDAYAPVEMDLPLLGNGGHKWFWAPGTDHLLLSVDQLMDIYYKSVGRGGVMLLNATPDTTGLIPEPHVAVYKAFGEEIHRRFGQYLQSIRGTGNALVMDFSKPTAVNHVIIREELPLGQRVRQYSLEGLVSGVWTKLASGTSIGSCRIDHFNTVQVSALRLRITDSAAEPAIGEFSVFDVEGFKDSDPESGNVMPITVGSWDGDTFSDTWKELEIDLTPYIDRIGQYELSFQRISHDWTKDWGLEFKDWEVDMYGKNVPEAVEKQGGKWSFIITRSQQTDQMDDFATVFKVKVRTKPGKTVGNIELRPIRFE
jgi:alpha-L-fucosidase